MARKLPPEKLLLMRFSSLILLSLRNIYFKTAINEACEAFNKVMTEFGYTQKLEIYDPTKHQTNPPQQHPFY